MIWLLGYLLVGLAFGLYVPWRTRRLREDWAEIPRSEVDRLEPGLKQAVSDSMVDMSTFALVVGGLLWPLQVYGFWKYRKYL